MYVIDHKDLESLFKALTAREYSLVGPILRDGAIIYDTITSVDDLPKGWTDHQQPASYAVHRAERESLFAYVVGPHSWKRFLYPPRTKLFTATKAGKGFEIEPGGDRPTKYAFIGVRACEICAMEVHDKIFATGEYADPSYKSRREQIFTVAVNCTRPGGNCFCVSMETGPKARSGYDLALTELFTNDSHCFLVEVGSEQGQGVLSELPYRTADQADTERAKAAMDAASESMGKSMDTSDIKRLLNDNFEDPQWDDIAKRCLACANCTMVCPTCFCSTVEDITDLAGSSAERWRRWDSCFTADFTKVAGGNIRLSTRTRFRQWMTHKLANWLDQFGTSGCVGCGRCITWCPVGIDITAEVRAIREKSVSTVTG